MLSLLSESAEKKRGRMQGSGREMAFAAIISSQCIRQVIVTVAAFCRSRTSWRIEQEKEVLVLIIQSTFCDFVNSSVETIEGEEEEDQ